MKTVAAFGEIMLRLSPPDRERFFQSPCFRAHFGGSEANVVASLAQFGHSTRFISAVPKNEIGSAAIRALRLVGVETDFIVRKGKRLGIYFAETGNNQKPTHVIYDRDHSGIAEAARSDIDWDKSLAGADWLHMTGITPAVSRSAADLTWDAVRAAKANGLQVSVDLNYRAKLWQYGVPAAKVMREIFKYADVGFANEDDCRNSLGIEMDVADPGAPPDIEAYEAMTLKVMEEFPNLTRLAVTLRESRSADHNVWSGVLRNRREFIAGPRYEIAHVVDRIGAGDAFAAGLIHGLDIFSSDRDALEFALAASCLKHSIPGDFNLVSESEVLILMKGDGSGRIRR
jgi:2-dehydro-3-deoxygluconokinase